MSAFFFGLAVVLASARLLGALSRRLGQPAVIGEIVAGIALGPTLLPASVGHALVPVSARPLLGSLAAVGLATFVFATAHEISASFAGEGGPAGRAVVGVATGSALLPLAGGCLIAMPFAADHGPAGQAPFVGFVAVAMSATALPVLARILADRHLATEPAGRLAMSSAALNDAFTWILLAAVVGGAATGGRWRVALVPVFVAALGWVVRPLLARVLAGDRPGDAVTVPFLLAGLALCCGITEWLGMHYVFGAFAFGVVVARSAPPARRRQVVARIRSAGTDVLLPVYFVTAGLQVDLTGLGAGISGVIAPVLAVAVLTKISGAYAGGRLTGLTRDEALTQGVLMNTRGLTEIVVLTVGLRLGLVDDGFYSAMVVMALVTTSATGPLLTLLDRVRKGRAASPVPSADPGALPAPRRSHRGR